MSSLTAPYRATNLNLGPTAGRLNRSAAQDAGFDAARFKPIGTHEFEFLGVDDGKPGTWTVTIEVHNNTGFWRGCCPSCVFTPALPAYRRAAKLCLWLGFLG